jgi:proline reductase-associated electron transfer protein PrdC
MYKEENEMQKEYYMQLSQCIGAPSEPIVKVGDAVKRGQMIAKCQEGKLGANLHASVSGKVSEVSDTCIVIEADEVQSEEFVPLTSRKPINLVKEAGIVGLGGAGFPTHVKLGTPFKEDGIVIVNAAECEPILEHNIEAIEENPEQLIRGLKICMEIVNAKKGAIAIKHIHPEAIAKLKGAIDTDSIYISELPNMYPMGEERAVVREVLGPVLEVDKLPSAAGAIVINAETVCRIQEAVDLKKPLIDKDMTVAGKINGALIKTFHNVPIGTLVSEMIEKAGGIGAEYGEIVMGGPFTGKRTSLDAPVVKTTGGILVAEQFWKGPEKLGLLVCACGGNKERLEQIAESMGSEVVGVEYCKQAHEMKNGALKCENPGRCPGQVQKVMALKKAGAQALLISNCTDCSNTVMSCAPQLKLPVYHCTDGPLRACNIRLIRKIKEENK